MNNFGQSISCCFLKLIIPKHYKAPKFLEELKVSFLSNGAVNLQCKVHIYIYTSIFFDLYRNFIFFIIIIITTRTTRFFWFYFLTVIHSCKKTKKKFDRSRKKKSLKVKRLGVIFLFVYCYSFARP